MNLGDSGTLLSQNQKKKNNEYTTDQMLNYIEETKINEMKVKFKNADNMLNDSNGLRIMNTRKGNKFTWMIGKLFLLMGIVAAIGYLIFSNASAVDCSVELKFYSDPICFD